MPNLFSVIADAHVSATDTAWANSGIRGDARYALKQFVDFSIVKRVQCAVGLGDLIDRSVNRSLAPAVWLTELRRLADNGIRFLYIQGNHDRADPPWLSLHPGAVHMHGRSLEIGESVLYGIDYQPADQLAAALASVPADAHVLLCHQGWSEFMHRPGTYQGSLADIARADLVLTGDLHAYRDVTVKSHAVDADIRVVSPGSTCKQAINEPDEHFVLLVDADTHVVSKKRLVSRPVLRSPRLTTSEQADAYLGVLRVEVDKAHACAAALGAPAEVCKPLVVVTYLESVDGVRRRLDRVLGDRAFAFTYSVAASDDVRHAESVPGTAGRVTIMDCLADEPGVRDDEKLWQLLTSLLSTTADVGEAEQRFRANFLKRR